VHCLDNKYVVFRGEYLPGHQFRPKVADDMAIEQTMSSGMLTLFQQTYMVKYYMQQS
jgi:hypothetical protein